MSLRVTNHYPDINEISVPRNAQVWVQFSDELEPNSVDYTHMGIHDSSTYSTLPGTIGVEYTDGTGDKVIFTPSIAMTPNTQYSVYIYEKPNCFLSKSNDEIDDTYSFSFTTGTGVIDYTGAPGVPSGTTETTYSADSYDSSWPTGSFQVISTSPQHQEPNVDVDNRTINMTLNVFPSGSCNLSGYIEIEKSDVL